MEVLRRQSKYSAGSRSTPLWMVKVYARPPRLETRRQPRPGSNSRPAERGTAGPPPPAPQSRHQDSGCRSTQECLIPDSLAMLTRWEDKYTSSTLHRSCTLCNFRSSPPRPGASTTRLHRVVLAPGLGGLDPESVVGHLVQLQLKYTSQSR